MQAWLPPHLFSLRARQGEGEDTQLVVQYVRHGSVSLDHFSPRPSGIAVKLALTEASHRNYPAAVVDITSVFLNADLPYSEQVAIRPPAGHGEPGEVWLLKRSLYGLRVAPSLWAQHLSDTLQGMRCYQSKLDPGVYVRH